jgi:hypothetical protein
MVFLVLLPVRAYCLSALLHATPFIVGVAIHACTSFAQNAPGIIFEHEIVAGRASSVPFTSLLLLAAAVTVDFRKAHCSFAKSEV